MIPTVYLEPRIYVMGGNGGRRRGCNDFQSLRPFRISLVLGTNVEFDQKASIIFSSNLLLVARLSKTKNDIG